MQEWVRKRGLRAYTEQRPHFIMGEDLIALLRQRAADQKAPLTYVSSIASGAGRPESPRSAWSSAKPPDPALLP